MTTMPFTKMVGAGNDFVVVDARRYRLPNVRWSSASRVLCDRHRGIGADGVLVLEPSRVAETRMRIFNPDGSEAEMCGNGARCVAHFLRQNGRHSSSVLIETTAGVLTARVRADRVAMRMTDPTQLRLGFSLTVAGRSRRAGFVNTGVPHLVVPVASLERIDVNRLGRRLRFHRAFAPHGTNVNFIQPEAAHPQRLRVRTYERGVEAETLACGTGLAASAVVYGLTRLGRRAVAGRGRRIPCRIDVRARSGERLVVTFTVTPHPRAARVTEVVLEGAARAVFEGTVSVPRRGAG